MRIVIVHLHLKFPETGGALRSYYLASGLAELGHDIEVITTHNESGYKKLQKGNFTVHYLPVKYDNSFGPIKRIRSYLRFNRKAYSLLKKLPSPDLLYCISTPLTVGLIGIKANLRLGLSYFFEVGDLWTDAPIQMGVIKPSWLQKYLYNMEERIYKNADCVVALSPPIKDSIQERYPGTKIIEVSNMSDIEMFKPSIPSNNDRFIIGYTGAIGKANHLEFLVSAAKHFEKEYPQVEFVVMGEGGELSGLKEKSVDLNNISFLPFGSRDEVAALLEKLSAVYISFKDIPVLETGCPNKFFDALAAGKLIITNFGGWISELAEENKCGIRYNPHDPKELEKKLMPFIEHRSKLEKAGNNARQLSLQYSREKVIKELNDYLATAQVLL